MDQKTQELVAAIQASNMEEADRAVSNLKDIFDRDDSRNTIPEEVFREVFLPFFFNPKSIDEVVFKDLAGKWIGIAGSPVSEVNVVDTEGHIVFVVPGFFNTDNLNTASTADRFFIETAIEYFDHRTVLPQVATNKVVQKLNSRADRIIGDSDKNLTKREQGWLAIANYYGLTLETNDKKESIQNNESNALDDIEYD